jgi:hypothetical protein
VYVIAGKQSENQVANLDHKQQPSPIQVEIRRDDWFELRQYPQPWLLSVAGERLMLLRDAIMLDS